MNDDVVNGEYTITLDNENHIVHVIAHGNLFEKLGKEIITKARLTAAEHQYNILYDVREAKINVSLADWFYLPRTLPVFNTTLHIKAAVIISPGNQKKEYEFYETVSLNQGINLRIFFNEESAVEWLKESQLSASI